MSLQLFFHHDWLRLKRPRGVNISYLLRLVFGTEILDLQVVLLAVALAQLILLQLSLQIQLLSPDLAPAREDLLQSFWHPGTRDSCAVLLVQLFEAVHNMKKKYFFLQFSQEYIRNVSFNTSMYSCTWFSRAYQGVDQYFYGSIMKVLSQLCTFSWSAVGACFSLKVVQCHSHLDE